MRLKNTISHQKIALNSFTLLPKSDRFLPVEQQVLKTSNPCHRKPEWPNNYLGITDTSSSLKCAQLQPIMAVIPCRFCLDKV